MNHTSATGPVAAEPRIRAAGDRALLVLLSHRTEVVELVEALRRNPLAGVEDVLPAAETVLVTLLSPAHAATVRHALDSLLSALQQPGPGQDSGDVSRGTLAHNDSPDEPLVVPVRYDGADLAEVARLLRLTEAEVVAAHTGAIWQCAFIGFAPGFGYLAADDARLHVPRRARARTAIPAGAVALAGGYSAVYPRSTPGGWQLIGTTELRMWDLDREPPALIRVGDRVRFVDVDG